MFLVVVLAAMVHVGPAAWAAGTAEKEAPPSKTVEIFQRVDATLADMEKLQAEVAKSSGEDRIVRRNQLRDRAVELLGELREASQDVLDREAKGMDAKADRRRVESLLKKLPRPFREHIDGLFQELDRLKRERDKATVEERPAIEDKIITINEELDTDLEIYLDLVQAMQKLGLDTARDRAYLEETVSKRAELLSGRIVLAKDRLRNAKRRLLGNSDDAALKAQVSVARQRLDRSTASLRTTIRIMDTLGLDTSRYKRELFQVTGDVSTGLFDREVISGLAEEWRDGITQWLGKNGLRVLLKVVLFILILFISWLLARLTRAVVRKSLEARRLKLSRLLERTTVAWSGKLVLFLGLLAGLGELGVELGPLLAGVGVAGFIVGFALQDTLSNFASGVMILMYRPYDVGDLIEAAGALGRVRDMSLVNTTILTIDNQTLVIPNNKIWGDVIKNVTAQRIRRVDMVFGISYGDDVEHAERVLYEIVEAHPKVLKDPEPIIKLHELGDSSVNFVVRPWVSTADYWDVYWDVTREVKIRFDAEGLSIPFPQHDVHIIQEGAPQDS